MEYAIYLYWGTEGHPCNNFIQFPLTRESWIEAQRQIDIGKRIIRLERRNDSDPLYVNLDKYTHVEFVTFEEDGD